VALACVSGRFALTPLTFWQTPAAVRCPDIWNVRLPFRLSAAAMLHARKDSSQGFVVRSGLLACAIAGTNYTGIFFAVALFRGILAVDSFCRKSLGSGKSCFCKLRGCGRNLAVTAQLALTGDPYFLSCFHAYITGRRAGKRKAAPDSLLLDTGASHTFSLCRC